MVKGRERELLSIEWNAHMLDVKKHRETAREKVDACARKFAPERE